MGYLKIGLFLFFSFNSLAMERNNFSECSRALGQSMPHSFNEYVSINYDTGEVEFDGNSVDYTTEKLGNGGMIQKYAFETQRSMPNKRTAKEYVNISIKRSPSGKYESIVIDREGNKQVMKWYDYQQSKGNMKAYPMNKTIVFRDNVDANCSVDRITSQALIEPNFKKGMRANLTEVDYRVCKYVSDYLDKNDEFKKCLAKDDESIMLKGIGRMINLKQDVRQVRSEAKQTELNSIMDSVISQSDSLNSFFQDRVAYGDVESYKPSAIHSIIAKCEDEGIMNNLRVEKEKNKKVSIPGLIKKTKSTGGIKSIRK
ncbi:hypothetical protein [Halobacteriovorax sp. CON-3]|uniref:hypothetical protein n=1 Tax=Halobacteriovorax sp. CON-3 TaxID=3157710 RepID=UPI00371C224B